ncbi:STAS domain-containing protein [Nucisporomicrobium flavum]|uniref:STAS domain-containing protein n=1 Tax=Nucisporomicrobium flavum TaxID=2785915 RepID=UPI0018F6A0BD|nr:STAS domain-containing protein [Nucisporomicrobium flavum]
MTYVINTRRLPEPTMAIGIEPQGEIRSKTAAGLLRDRFVMVLAAIRPERIVVDLSAVPSISEDGIEALRSGCDKAAVNEARVAVVHSAPEVREQLRRHGLDELVAS